MLKIVVFLVIFAAMASIAFAAPGDTLWTRTYGGSSFDYGHSVQQDTTDGGYIVAANVTNRAWILKLDSSGNLTWDKTYGGSNLDGAFSIQQTSDGGYIAAGYTESFGAGGEDFWILKLNSP